TKQRTVMGARGVQPNLFLVCVAVYKVYFRSVLARTLPPISCHLIRPTCNTDNLPTCTHNDGAPSFSALGVGVGVILNSLAHTRTENGGAYFTFVQPADVGCA